MSTSSPRERAESLTGPAVRRLLQPVRLPSVGTKSEPCHEAKSPLWQYVGIMLATLVVSLLVSAVATSTEGSFQGATVEITDLGGCTGCVGGITRAMKRIDGVIDAALVEGSTIRVTAEDGIWIDPDELRDIVRNVGYTAGTIASVCRGTLAKKEGRAVFTAASAPDEASLAVEDPEGLISEAVTARAHFVSTDSSPTPVLQAIDD